MAVCLGDTGSPEGRWRVHQRAERRSVRDVQLRQTAHSVRQLRERSGKG